MGYPQEVAAPPQATAHHQRLAAQDYLDMVVVVEAQGDLLLDLIMEHLRLLQYQVMVAQVQVQSALAIQLHQVVAQHPLAIQHLQVEAQYPQAM